MSLFFFNLTILTLNFDFLKSKNIFTYFSRFVQEALNQLEAAFPGVKERIVDASGELHRFVNIYINSEDVRFLQGLETSLNDGDEVSIVPAVAGG